MIVLELEHVVKRYRHGSRVPLDDVSLVIEAGEMVVVWGERLSGRSTLLRVAAGIERPDAGVVRFSGRVLAGGGQQIEGGICFCRREFGPYGGATVVEQLVAAQLARKVPRSVAQANAWGALERVGAEPYAPRVPGELRAEEVVRVSLARALTGDPRLIVIDEPTIGVDTLVRDGILRLLRSLADDGIAVLSSTVEGTGFLGADRVLSLGKGKLNGELTPGLAQVTDLERHRRIHA